MGCAVNASVAEYDLLHEELLQGSLQENEG